MVWDGLQVDNLIVGSSPTYLSDGVVSIYLQEFQTPWSWNHIKKRVEVVCVTDGGAIG